ncbi:hypothetical protein Hte_006652 [Hypoxylon texense]
MADHAANQVASEGGPSEPLTDDALRRLNDQQEDSSRYSTSQGEYQCFMCEETRPLSHLLVSKPYDDRGVSLQFYYGQRACPLCRCPLRYLCGHRISQYLLRPGVRIDPLELKVPCPRWEMPSRLEEHETWPDSATEMSTEYAVTAPPSPLEQQQQQQPSDGDSDHEDPQQPESGGHEEEFGRHAPTPLHSEGAASTSPPERDPPNSGGASSSPGTSEIEGLLSELDLNLSNLAGAAAASTGENEDGIPVWVDAEGSVYARWEEAPEMLMSAPPQQQQQQTQPLEEEQPQGEQDPPGADQTPESEEENPSKFYRVWRSPLHSFRLARASNDNDNGNGNDDGNDDGVGVGVGRTRQQQQPGVTKTLLAHLLDAQKPNPAEAYLASAEKAAAALLKRRPGAARAVRPDTVRAVREEYHALVEKLRRFRRQHEAYATLEAVAVDYRDARERALRERFDRFWRGWTDMRWWVAEVREECSPYRRGRRRELGDVPGSSSLSRP